MFFFMGKSVNPLKMVIFNSKLLVYQRVFQIFFETLGCWKIPVICGECDRFRSFAAQHLDIQMGIYMYLYIRFPDIHTHLK